MSGKVRRALHLVREPGHEPRIPLQPGDRVIGLWDTAPADVVYLAFAYDVVLVW